MPSVVDLLHRMPHGAVFTRAELVAMSSHHTVRRAVDEGHLVRLGRGRYRRVMPELLAPAGRSWSRWEDEPTDVEIRAVLTDLALARAYGGVLAGLSAARAHGWMLLEPPPVTTIVVPRAGRPRRVAETTEILRRDLPSSAIDHDRTTALVTCLECLRTLPLPSALAVADSALRSGDVGAHELREASDRCRGRGAVAARRVAVLADGRAANPFESAVRAVASTVDGLHLTPQVPIRVGRRVHRVDLADEGLRVVVEADSYEFHGGKDAFAADVERYNALTATGWSVFRVTWRQVTVEPEGLRALLARAVSARRRTA